jgi:hypothetical protein
MSSSSGDDVDVGLLACNGAWTVWLIAMHLCMVMAQGVNFLPILVKKFRRVRFSSGDELKGAVFPWF